MYIGVENMDELKPTLANSCPLTPLTFLERAATVYGDCISIIYNDIAYTWVDTHRRCLQVASCLCDLGITRGDVVSVLAFNVPAMYELQFAVPMSGAVLNNINTRLDTHAISVILSHSGSKLVFVDSNLISVAEDAVSRLRPGVQHPRLVVIKENMVSPILSHVNYYEYEDLVERGDAEFKWMRPHNEWDPITLNYTSGTTSSPKGAVHSHRAIFVMTMDSLIDWSVPKQPVYLWTLPMFHCNGWCFTWGMAAVGGTNICLRKFDGATVFDTIGRHKVTHMCGAPVVLSMLCNSLEAKPLQNPVHVITAGAPPPATVIQHADELGFIVSHGYGMTEVAGVVVSGAWKEKWNQLPIAERAKLKTRQGVRTLGLTEVNVVDPESGVGVKRDGLSKGEIVFRGASLMLGYLKNRQATDLCMREDGWLYTGDVGVIHPDGYLEIKDRSKDVIITGGENVSSVEVESVLYSNPAVNEAAVVAQPDKFWGETPCAFMSLKVGGQTKPTADQIISFCRDRLPHYMVPKTVVFMEELPKTSTGKIMKSALREMASKDTISLNGKSRL